VDATVRLWDLRQSGQTRSFREHACPVNSVAVSPDGQWLASAGGADNSIIVGGLRTGRVRWRARLSPGLDQTYAVGAVRFSPDGRLLAAAGYGNLSLWEADTGKRQRQLAAPAEDFAGIAFAPGGRVLAAACGSAVRLFEVTTGKEIAPDRVPYPAVSGVAFSPDGRLLAAALHRQLRVYDSTTRREVRRLVGEYDYGGTSKVRFSAGGDRLVAAQDGGAGGYAGRVRVWQVGDWKPVQGSGLEADPPRRSNRLVAPDLRTMLLWQWAGRPGPEDLRVCDATTGRELRKLRGPGGRIWEEGKPKPP
jgi:WD40 repeat protein